MYLELQLDTQKFPFSSDCFGISRSDLKSAAEFPQFPFGNLHDTFNLYVLLLVLEQHLPSNFRSKLIEKMRPNKIGTVNFFVDCKRFPDDLDTTAVFYHSLLKTHTVTEREIAPLAQSIYKHVDENGVLLTYFVSKENARYNRSDAVSIINIVRFAYEQGHENLIKPSEDYVFDWLNSGKYKSATLYYPSAYTFLYFCSQHATTNNRTKTRFMDTLRREFNQINQEDLIYPLDYALTILTGVELGIRNEYLTEKLLDMQNEDGSWPADAMYYTNKSKIYFGSKSISTIFSVLALMQIS